MAKFKGRELLIKVETAPNVFTTLSAQTSSGFTINNESVDVTDKDGSGWRELLEGAGITSMSLTASGYTSDNATYTFVLGKVMANEHFKCRVVRGLGDEFEGMFMAESTGSTGEYNGAETFELSLQSAGAIAYTP